jgi:membrane-associated phospholipid phosphatase
MSARVRGLAFAWCAPLALTLFAGFAEAQTSDAQGSSKRESRAPAPHRLNWQWHRFNAVDYVSTAVFGAAYLYVEFATKTPRDPNWTGGILFDDAFRDASVSSRADTRNFAGALSDWFTLAPQIHVVIDSTAVPLADNWNVDVAWQMMVINLQAQAVTGFITRSGHHFIARQRPDVEPCRADPDYSEKCFGGSNASFPSGHVSGAAVGAGLVCTHHAFLPLYGRSLGGVIACGVDVAMTATSGVLRMVADRHYISDVIVGAAVGFGAGVGLPVLLHYRERPAPAQRSAYRVRWTLAPLAHPDAPGLGVYGWF